MSSRLAVSQQIKVSPLVLGTNVFGWTADADVSHKILDEYVDGGGNFIDTADSYSFWAEGNSGGEAETIIGSWLARRDDRDELLVASKVSHHPQLSGMAPATINAAIDGSLARLGLDHLDIYYAHFDDSSTPLAESIEAMSGLVDSGKIRSIGISNYSPERITQWLEISEREGFHLPVALEPHYNLMERGIEDSLLPLAQEHSLDVFPYYSLAHGFLTGKYRGNAEVDSVRAADAGQYLTPRGERVLAALVQVSEGRACTFAPIALAWLRAKTGVTAPIASARTVAQLQPLVANMHLALTECELQLLDEASQP
ncbi:aldo/keto reductase [Paeniglutamicibacter psychrophenolicus]|uniref:aldo/keto reductase n=1 Tax=Paeniglutamicibacter psychrophenolicus TaxID=257454 RepID=UPI002783C33A|nr:aldo/keto reductase [Paeniglutamicibacter psychrophenolicus]MDQ0092260.1 aryl-alcohol dehydrogenase-like predicted oxidoreductase [Paeniglutamicibacter psychrophenolicus]